MSDHPNTTVFVTGASAGIGEACARRFAGGGARLLLCARRLDRLEALAADLEARHGTSCHVVRLDVRDAAEVESVWNALPESWQTVDVLVNNAGLGRGLAPVYAQRLDDLDEMVDTNVKGLLYVTRTVVPGMVARNRGHVINIGSIAGHEVYAGGTAYCATKHAVDAITRGLIQDLHGTDVRVSTVDPGLVETDFSRVRFRGDEERARAVYAGARALTAEDVADAVVYCATRPPHVNIAEIIITTVDQASATRIHRNRT